VAIAYERVVIRDLGSRNRVRVNGRIIDEARLNSGDEVAIAHFLYRVEILAPPPGNGASKPPKPVVARAPSPAIEIDDDLIPLD
jgi:pSer/pThr/pTyr-binding forkhead associated (FHA) protein